MNEWNRNAPHDVRLMTGCPLSTAVAAVCVTDGDVPAAIAWVEARPYKMGWVTEGGGLAPAEHVAEAREALERYGKVGAYRGLIGNDG